MTKHEIATEIPNPCKVCGSVQYIIKHHFEIWIQCKRCGNKGGTANNLKDAIEKWNRQNVSEADR